MSDDTPGCMLHGYWPPCPLCTASATIPVVTPAPPAAPDVDELVQRLRMMSPDLIGIDAAVVIERLAADLARVERERDEARIELERARSLLFHAQDDLRSGDEGNLSREIDQFWDDTRKQGRAAIAARGG